MELVVAESDTWVKEGGRIHASKTLSPVCGKTIEDKTARYRATFKGNAYYLCSFECESSFKDNPERYI